MTNKVKDIGLEKHAYYFSMILLIEKNLIQMILN